MSHTRTRRSLSRALAAEVERCEERILLASIVDPNLAVRTAAAGLVTPIGIAFLGERDFLVAEKNTGQVRRVVGGVVQSTPVLDLAVNFASERGLLGIALHPDFASSPFVYLYWTESTTGADSGALDTTPLLGNRVDRFLWNGTSLTHDRNIIRLRALQPPNPPHEAGTFGNHDGGVIRFGPDGKLYVFVGDLGRRGQLQNLTNGPLGPGQPDDQFGGPQPDDAHLTGVILRLNDDGSTPADNPFFAAGASIGGQVGANVQQIFSYGHRNAIGMAFDPASGNLWLAENGDDTFSELNLVEPGMNGGWTQIMGPVARVAEYKAIETSSAFFGLQQQRWSPVNIADSPSEALSRLFMLPGAHYADPKFSWRYEVAPGGAGFFSGPRLGPQYAGDLFVGAAARGLEGGHLFRFDLSPDRTDVAVSDPRLADGVADNGRKYDITESESLLFGRDFGVATDVQTGPNGNLYVVSLTGGVVYEIFHIARPGLISSLGRTDDDFDVLAGNSFEASLSGSAVVPPVATSAQGVAEFELGAGGSELQFRLSVSGLQEAIAAHLQFGNSPPIAILFNPPTAVTLDGVLAEGTIAAADLLAGVTFDELLGTMRAGAAYVVVHTRAHPSGEIRGQIGLVEGALTASLELDALDRVFEEQGAVDPL